jgi:hypothetical protein
MQHFHFEIPSGELSLSIKHTEYPLHDLCGFASRQNPKRGFLFVSKVLGKHYPVRPSKMQEVYHFLSDEVEHYLNSSDCPIFLGFAETATGLSSGLYHTWYKKYFSNSSYKKDIADSVFVHTTRYHFEEKNVLFHFQEEHSHATGHIVYEPEQADFQLDRYNTLVLIDDEITTGKTMTNFIEGFTKLKNSSIKKVIVVSIKNWMDELSQERFYQIFPHIEFQFVQALKGTYSFKQKPGFVCAPMPNVEGSNNDKSDLINHNFGRFGLKHFDVPNFEKMINLLDSRKKTIVLGTGEFSYYPFLLAKAMEEKGFDVMYQSTTRSPILVGKDIAHKIEFVDNYGDNIPNFIYNVAVDQYEQVVMCYETKDQQMCDLSEKLGAVNFFFSV